MQWAAVAQALAGAEPVGEDAEGVREPGVRAGLAVNIADLGVVDENVLGDRAVPLLHVEHERRDAVVEGEVVGPDIVPGHRAPGGVGGGGEHGAFLIVKRCPCSTTVRGSLHHQALA